MQAIKLISIALEKEGFDGLFIGGICGCKNGNLSPANCLTDECESGYAHHHSKTGEWVIHKNKEPITDEVIQELINGCG